MEYYLNLFIFFQWFHAKRYAVAHDNCVGIEAAETRNYVSGFKVIFGEYAITYSAHIFVVHFLLLCDVTIAFKRSFLW